MTSIVRREPAAAAASTVDVLRITLEMMRSEHEHLQERTALERQRAAELRRSAAQICAETKALHDRISPYLSRDRPIRERMRS